MSRAFVKEDANSPQEAGFEPIELDAGNKLYFTPSGLDRLNADLGEVQSSVASATDLNAKANLKNRLQYLEKLSQRAEVIDPVRQSGDTIRFGATVSVRDEEDSEKVFRIVGIYEADSKSGKISYLSPVAKALLGKRAGDDVVIETPQAEHEFEILKVEYLPID